MSILGTTFIEKFEEFCPLELAESGDPVGLHIGTLNKPVKRIMMTLAVRPEVVEEAIQEKVDLLIAKHPPIFRPIKRLLTDDPQNRMYEQLLKHDIAVYAAHTNMDIIENGLNDWFCEMLEIQDTTYLEETHSFPYKKLVVFAPSEVAATIRQALGEVGAGQIGAYTDCSFSVTGTGRFTPQAAAHPYIGETNIPEVAAEERIEVIFPALIQKQVVKALKETHPYEEPVYFLSEVENYQKKFGLGRIGTLPKPLKLSAFTAKVKEAFQLSGVQLITDDEDQLVQKIAICGGSGGKFYPTAIKKGADVYITGDVYYHTGHDMLSAGLSVIDPGHYIEAVCKDKFVELFEQWKQEENWDVEFISSKVNTNPFRWV